MAAAGLRANALVDLANQPLISLKGNVEMWRKKTRHRSRKELEVNIFGDKTALTIKLAVNPIINLNF